MNNTADRKSSRTFQYTLINILYFAAFCTIHAYAGVFLLDKGFTNTQVGLALAAANILSVAGQPFVAGIVDKNKTTNRFIVMFSSFLLLAGSVLLLFVRSGAVVIFTVFVLMYTIQFVYQPMMIAMNFEYSKAGCRINFGLARGMGSAGFAVTSVFLGRAVESFGTDVILYVTIAAMAAMVAVVYFFKKPKKTDEGEDVVSVTAGDGSFEGKRDTGIIAFVKTYPSFVLFLLGVACCFFAHNMINDFMIQIIRSLGGNETQMGYATFLQAILELPVMAVMGYILAKVKDRYVLVFSGAAFLVKTLILLFAQGMPALYVSQSFQLFAYAVFIPTAAYFAERVMKERDKVKGQAYVNSAITLGGVFSNLICGKILDVSGVKAMLTTGVAVCTAGMIIIAVAVLFKKKTVSD